MFILPESAVGFGEVFGTSAGLAAGVGAGLLSLG
jgi:hypothetical protein